MSISVDNVDGYTVSDELEMLSGTVGMGTADAFNRSQLWWKRTNDSDPDNSSASYVGDGGVLRMGMLAADGDASNQISEGIIVYGMNGASGAMTSPNFGYARVKPQRFQLRQSVSSVQSDIFIADEDKLTFRPYGVGNNVFYIDNANCNIYLPLSMQQNTISDIEGLTFISDSNGIDLVGGTVTQLSSVSSPVTINKHNGIITTFSGTLTSNTAVFVVTNSKVSATSVINLTINSYTGIWVSAGIPLVSAESIGAGQFSIRITNALADNGYNGSLEIAFLITT